MYDLLTNPICINRKEKENYLTVGELKEQLKDVPDDAIVVLSSDSEGNNYSPLADGYTSYYEPECTWMGTVYNKYSYKEDEDYKTMYEENIKDGTAVKCLVLFPIN